MTKENFFIHYFPILCDFAKIVIPSFFTYLVTKYSINSPKRYEIHYNQFHCVYQPLYLLYKQFLIDNQDRVKIQNFIKKSEKIIYNNYHLVFPKTLKLLNEIKLQVEDPEQTTFCVINFSYQIEHDYEKLKKQLGYPTNSFREFFKRLNKIDKIFYSFCLIFLFLGLFCLTCVFSFVFTLKISEAILYLIVSILSFFMSYLMYYTRS